MMVLDRSRLKIAVVVHANGGPTVSAGYDVLTAGDDLTNAPPVLAPGKRNRKRPFSIFAAACRASGGIQPTELIVVLRTATNPAAHENVFAVQLFGCGYHFARCVDSDRWALGQGAFCQEPKYEE